MTRSRSPRAARRGLTLFELLVVLALLVVIAALAVPTLEGMSPYFKTTAAVDQVRAHWNEARVHSIEEGRPYRFAIKPNTGSYRVAPDSAQYWGGNEGNGGGQSDDSGTKLDLSDDLPDGVTFSYGGGGGSDGWSTIVTFLPDGTTLEDVEVMFQSTGTRPMGLRIRSLTGTITAIRPQGGGQ